MPKGIQGMVGYFDNIELVTVCGGSDGQDYLDTCFEYSLWTDEWNEAIFKLKEGRSFAVSSVVHNGSFFVLGGQPSHETSEFPIEGRYGPMLPYVGWGNCLCRLNKTHLFMAGGYGSGIAKLVYVLDLDTGEWFQLPDLIEARKSHVCHSIKGGNEVLAIGGEGKSSVESFYFDSMSWREVNPLPREIMDARNTVKYKDTFIVVGGFDHYSNPRYLDTLYEFVPFDYSWIERSEKLTRIIKNHLSLPLKSGWKEHANVCPDLG